MTLGKLGEFGLISRLTSDIKSDGPEVVQGIGDDTAVLRLCKDRLLLATCDVQIDGIHFLSDAFQPEQIGGRAAAVNLSDIAAMGGTPTFAIVSLAAPLETQISFLEGVYAGLRAGLNRWGAEIVGGNTAELPERVMIDVTLLGEVSPDRLLLRSRAEPSDILCVTGDLGASAAGLKLLETPSIQVDKACREKAISAYRTPVPRIPEGSFLGKTGMVTSCIDLSDGLLGDAAHIAKMSDVTVCIDFDRVPIDNTAICVADAADLDVNRLALSGGEDFELLFTSRSSAVEDVIKKLEYETGTRASIIGEIRSGSSEVQIEKQGRSLDIPAGGFEHFGNRNGRDL